VVLGTAASTSERSLLRAIISCGKAFAYDEGAGVFSLDNPT
jgi:hypothetical protein